MAPLAGEVETIRGGSPVGLFQESENGLKTTICVILPWFVQNKMPFVEYSYSLAPFFGSITYSGSPYSLSMAFPEEPSLMPFVRAPSNPWLNLTSETTSEPV